MATTTTNLGLTKPDYTDAADIAVINTNMDTVDTAITATNTAITATKSDLGIVEDGNTATHSITAGQYVIWKGNLYTAKSAIATGTTLSTSNLTAVSNGGLNSLNEQIGNMIGIQINATGGGALAPNQYAVGLTVEDGGSVVGYGTILTIKYSNTRCTQIALSYNSVMKTRGAASATVWNSWT